MFWPALPFLRGFFANVPTRWQKEIKKKELKNKELNWRANIQLKGRFRLSFILVVFLRPHKIHLYWLRSLEKPAAHVGSTSQLDGKMERLRTKQQQRPKSIPNLHCACVVSSRRYSNPGSSRKSKVNTTLTTTVSPVATKPTALCAQDLREGEAAGSCRAHAASEGNDFSGAHSQKGHFCSCKTF